MVGADHDAGVKAWPFQLADPLTSWLIIASGYSFAVVVALLPQPPGIALGFLGAFTVLSALVPYNRRQKFIFLLIAGFLVFFEFVASHEVRGAASLMINVSQAPSPGEGASVAGTEGKTRSATDPSVSGRISPLKFQVTGRS